MAALIVLQFLSVAALIATAQCPAFAQGDSYTASTDFSSSQGYRNWYYLDSTGAQMYFNGWAWQGPETYLLLWSNGGHPGNYNDAIRQWRAPANGSVRITGTVFDANVNCGSGVLVSIRNGNQVLWQQTIENGDTVGFTYDLMISVTSGDQLNFVINNRGDWNCDSTNFDPTITLNANDSVLGSIRNSPYGTARVQIPGTIEGENFDNGGSEVAYHDTTAGSFGQDYDNPPNYPLPSFRQPTDVDIYKCGCYSNNYLVLMQAGDWMNYSVDITQDGLYTLEARVAWGGGAGGNFHIEFDGVDVTGPMQIHDTNWGLTIVTKSGLDLPKGNHTMRVVADTNGSYNITGDIDYLRFTFDNASYATAGTETSIPVRIDFDQVGGVPIPNNTPIGDQWLGAAGVRFYSSNPAYPVRTWNICGTYCSTTSKPNFIWTGHDQFYQTSASTIVEFTKPVSNLSFYIIGIDVFFDPFCVIDLYRNGAHYGSYTVYGNASTTRWISFGLDNISKVVIRNSIDGNGIGFDDFNFNVPADVKITSGRVGGYLNGTTQQALLGGDIALQATPLPGGFAGGTYAWTCAPSAQCQILTPQNSSSVTLRANEVGTFTVTVSYTKNNATLSSSVTVNSILPTLVSYTAQQSADLITPPSSCRDFPADRWWFYGLGCPRSGPPGITFSARIRVPPNLLSDLTKSGVKYVQAVSAFRKHIDRGLRCNTRRIDQANIASGWQLDSNDPYGGGNEFLPLSVTDSLGYEFGFPTDDSPGRALTVFNDWDFVDSLYVDDYFEMYVLYYTLNQTTPAIQRPLGKLAWNWGGLVVFDWNGTNAIHTIRYSNAPATSRTGEIFPPALQNMNSVVPMQGNVTNIPEDGLQCPDGPPLTNNRIDSSREFVKYHYIDFLGRDPNGEEDANGNWIPGKEPDPIGWNFWTSGISQCIFDLNCVHVKRVQTGLAFFYSSEFISGDPDMANPPGSPGFNAPVYNRAFVKHCYIHYLGRHPINDIEGWDFWTEDLNNNGNYFKMIDAFQLSTDYRGRPFQ